MQLVSWDVVVVAPVVVHDVAFVAAVVAAAGVWVDWRCGVEGVVEVFVVLWFCWWFVEDFGFTGGA